MPKLSYPAVTEKTYAEAFRTSSVALSNARRSFDICLAIATSTPTQGNIASTLSMANTVIRATNDFLALRAIILELRELEELSK